MTVISSTGFEDEAAAKEWLERCRRDESAQRDLTGGSLLVVNRAIHGHRVAGSDPYVRDVSQAQAQAIRIGYGTGDDVVDGHWRDAYDVHLEAAKRSNRRQILAPQEELAGILSGKVPAYVSDDLVIRARLDVEQGRHEQAALQLRAGLDAFAAEMARDEEPTRGGNAVDKHISLSHELSAEALKGKLSDDHVVELRETITQVERLLRRRRYRGGSAV